MELLPFIFGTLMYGSLLFTITAGFTLIFGAMKVINIAHPMLFVYGGYIAYSLCHLLSPKTPLFYILIFLLAAVITGLIAVSIELGLFRPMYKLDPTFQILITFGLLISLDDLIRIIWGKEMKSISEFYQLLGTMNIAGHSVTTYNWVILALSVFIACLIAFLVYKTDFGRAFRATSYDREMAFCIGLNVPRLFTIVFLISGIVTGLGGAFLSSLIPLYPGLVVELVVLSFIVTVSGGMGSFGGALLFSYLIGALRTLAVWYFPELDLFLIFLVMVVILALRPYGLLGKEV
jgi:branched-chain amino acid transport system permease protein